jgi:hypothetical protein
MMINLIYEIQNSTYIKVIRKVILRFSLPLILPGPLILHFLAIRTMQKS